MSFPGRTVIVTGAGQGIGRAIATRFAAEGASVVIADVDDAGGTATIDAICAAGQKARFVRCDVGSSEAVNALIADVRARRGPARCAGQQCRRARQRRFPRSQRSRFRPRDPGQPERRVPDGPGRRAADGGPGESGRHARRDHQPVAPSMPCSPCPIMRLTRSPREGSPSLPKPWLWRSPNTACV